MNYNKLTKKELIKRLKSFEGIIEYLKEDAERDLQKHPIGYSRHDEFFYKSCIWENTLRVFKNTIEKEEEL